MSRKKLSNHPAIRSKAAAKWIAHKRCAHGWKYVVDPQGREWRYCHRCNLYEIVRQLERQADEEGA